MNTQKRITLALVLLGGLLLASVVLAAPTAPTLDRYVIGGGGGLTEVGIYTLEGTIGQALVGANSTAPFDLCSGFWCGLDVDYTPFSYYISLPLVLRQSP